MPAFRCFIVHNKHMIGIMFSKPKLIGLWLYFFLLSSFNGNRISSFLNPPTAVVRDSR